jgi:hypothetical protein
MPGSNKAGSPKPIRSTSAEPPKRHRSNITNNPMRVRANHRTPQGRRIRDLYRSYLRSMGSPTEPRLQSDALACAELRVAAENERAKVLAGHGSADDLVRLENLAARAERKLALPKGAPKGPTLAEALAQAAKEASK